MKDEQEETNEEADIADEEKAEYNDEPEEEAEECSKCTHLVGFRYGTYRIIVPIFIDISSKYTSCNL